MAKRPSEQTRKLVQKIENITSQRIKQHKVVSLAEFRSLKKPQEPLTLLIIEDDETIRAALKRLFESENYRVITAADGTQLSSVLDDSPIDLIILDVGLPWINGFELAVLMKEHKDLREIPLVFVSGRGSEADIKRGFSVGADDYITKPFEIEVIKKSVKTLLRLQQP